MNKERYEKVRRLAEQSPFPGERAAAREALQRMAPKKPPKAPEQPGVGYGTPGLNAYYYAQVISAVYPEFNEKAFFRYVVGTFTS